MGDVGGQLDWWQELLQKHAKGVDDRIVFTGGLYVLNIVVFWGLNTLLYFCYKYNLFPKQRINPGDFPPQSLINECLTNLAVSHLILYPLVAYLMFPLFTYFGMEVNAPVPHISVFARDFVVCIVLNDTLFYWAHRALHHPSIYQYIHKKHHRFNYSIGIAAGFAHPVEDLFANLIPTLLGCLVMGSHIVILWTWLAIRLAETVDAHSGYAFKLSPFHLLPMQGGAARHDFHHSKNVGCYGSFFIFWDWITGTDKAFLEFQKKKEANISDATSKKQK